MSGGLPDVAVVQGIAGDNWSCYQRNEKMSTFCTVRDTVNAMTTTEFAMVTTKLCLQYNGFLQLVIQP